MATKEEIKPETFLVDPMKRENAGSSFVVLTKPLRALDREERSVSALDLRTGNARKRSYSGGEEEAIGAPRSKIAKRKPTDQELALNFFIKQLALELLDRRLTIVQQPRHRLAQLEAACRRQFPAFNERQIRLKIRGQLKLYRRNLKKAEERKLAKPHAISPRSSAFEGLPPNPLDHSPSYLACNPNAVWIARRALANERKRGKPLINPSTSLTPLKSINDWQNVNAVPVAAVAAPPPPPAAAVGAPAVPIVVTKPLPTIRPNSRLEAGMNATKCAFLNASSSSASSSSVPAKRAQSNPLESTSLSSQSTSALSPSKPTQTNNSAVMAMPLKALLEENKEVKPSDSNVSHVDSSNLNSSGLDGSTGQTPQSRHLNQTWPPPVFTPPADASAYIIASCLRLAANFLLQSATFFESKSAPMSDLHSPLQSPPLLQPSGLPLIVNPIFGGSLPAVPPLGTATPLFPDVSLVCSTPTIISTPSSSKATPSVNHPVTTIATTTTASSSSSATTTTIITTSAT